MMERTAWAQTLFRRSVLKQEKYRQIAGMMGNPRDKQNLDLGGDNGILSLLLRLQGGSWSSADLDEQTVESIRGLVTDRVFHITGASLPFADQAFDQIIIIDYLEHVDDDAAAVQELRRVLKPGGTLIVNVPHPRPGTFLSRCRIRLGLTDEWHGHRRPGYTGADLKWLLAPWFQLDSLHTYSKSFSESLDVGLNAMYERMRKAPGKSSPSSKGTVVTGPDMGKNPRAFRLLSLLYPFMWLFSRLDSLLIGQKGYKLIARATLVLERHIDHAPAPDVAKMSTHRRRQAESVEPANAY
ncbi:MAG: class I SAM-dependent methyltransferase [Gemmatimonadota bacterium]